MSLQEWLLIFRDQLVNTSLLEWLAVALAVAEVLLARVNNVWLYPAGIVSTCLYTYLMASSGLFAESALNIYYLVMSIYGWVHWLKRRSGPQLPITYTSRREWGVTISIVIMGWVLLYYVLHIYTNSNVPLWDAGVSAIAWAGMWLLAKRKIENWVLLNISNLFAIPLLFYKKLPLTGCLYIFLFIVAIFGYVEWKRLYRQQTVST